MEYGEEIRILGLDWALLHFVENNGMAFGLSLGGDYGKLALSLFRIFAVGALIYYIRLLIQGKANFGILASFALILAGALGNIIDSAFYGLIFSESPYHGGLATLFPAEGGYASFLHGKVVDMFYFPILRGTFPDWLPIWGGDTFLFFRPVFNIADTSITIGVASIILFHRNFFNNTNEVLDPDAPTNSVEPEEQVEEAIADEETTDVEADVDVDPINEKEGAE